MVRNVGRDLQSSYFQDDTSLQHRQEMSLYVLPFVFGLLTGTLLTTALAKSMNYFETVIVDGHLDSLSEYKATLWRNSSNRIKSEYNHEYASRELCSEEWDFLHIPGWDQKQEAWKRLDSTRLQAATKDWKQSMSNVAPYDSALHDGGAHGIIIIGSDQNYRFLLLNVQILRTVNCTLPIEVWHLTSELRVDYSTELQKYGVTIRDLSASSNHVQLQSTRVHESAARTAAIMNSAFGHVLFMDVDTLAFRDPSYLFDLPHYKQTSGLFWPGFWKTQRVNPVFDVFELVCYDEFTFHTGLFLINKKRAWKALNLAWYMHTKDADLYHLLLPSNEGILRFALKATQTLYHVVAYYPSAAGMVYSRRFCGHSTILHDVEGEASFLNAQIFKTARDTGRIHGFSLSAPWTHAKSYVFSKNTTDFEPVLWYTDRGMECVDFEQYAAQCPKALRGPVAKLLKFDEIAADFEKKFNVLQGVEVLRQATAGFL